jgi:hypothetical protein
MTLAFWLLISSPTFLAVWQSKPRNASVAIRHRLCTSHGRLPMGGNGINPNRGHPACRENQVICKAIQTVLTAFSLLLPSLTAAAAPYQQHGAIEHAQLLDALDLEGELFHVQGVELDGQHVWVTSVDLRNRKGYIHEFDLATGRFVRRLELTDGVRYHPGGISIYNRSIWVPVAELKRHSSTVLEEIDADSLQIRRKIYVADHLGCVAASGRNLVAGNWNSKSLYIFDLSNEARVQVVPNPSRTRYQDMKFIDGQLVAGGSLTRRSGTIDWIDWPTMTLVRTLRTGATSGVKPFGHVRPYSAEGMALRGRELYVLPEDGPSRLFHFRLDADVGQHLASAKDAKRLPLHMMDRTK